MPRFTVIHADKPSVGRGCRGRTLSLFLKCFAGQRNVRDLKSSNLSRRRMESADYLFIGIPTRLTSSQLSSFNARNVILFDYADCPEADWNDSDRKFLTSLTDRYFKPCVSNHWNPKVHWGCLPLRRNWKLTTELIKRRVREKGKPQIPEKKYDIGFMGYPTCLTEKYGANHFQYPQRINWMKELAGQRDWTKWGGICSNTKWRKKLEQTHGDLSDIYIRNNRLPYRHYFKHLNQCRTVLTPAGNARWTYRHYESVYTRSMMLSTDLSAYRLLIPLPKSNLVYVEDHASILPFISLATSLFNKNSELVLDAERELEQYLRNGQYSRQRPLVWERFESELSGAFEHGTNRLRHAS